MRHGGCGFTLQTTESLAVPIPLTKQPSRKAAIAAPTFDWLPLWAMSLGFAAVMIATIAYFAAADQTGAMFVLLGAAGLIALVLRASAPER